ncbi:hypothetical protein BsWGS_04231 [Bradybaena similaris]
MLIFYSLDPKAFRTCLEDGSWQNNWTNYSACIQADPSVNESFLDATNTPIKRIQNTQYVQLILALKDIMIVTTSMSLVFLVIAFFIFSYFRSLQCSRNSIHKNLVASFIFRFILVIVQFQPYIFSRGPSYRDLDWLCKTVLTLHQYFQTANFAWMLVEGIYLHNRLVVSVFPSAAPFKLFYFIGWGIPLIITSFWAALMHHFYKDNCWIGFAQHHLIFILAVPIVLALVVNSAFLVNIIRVLVVKLRTNNLVESRRMRKAIKATVVLLPLLGVANLLFLAQPVKEGTAIMSVYRVINGLLPSLQGVFVSVLYCFMNSEVQNVIKKKWKRFRTNRAMNTRTRRQESYLTRDRDYHSMSVLHMTPERETKAGSETCKNGPVPDTNDPASHKPEPEALTNGPAVYRNGPEGHTIALEAIQKRPIKSTKSKKPLRKTVSLATSKIPEVIEVVCANNQTRKCDFADYTANV